MLSWPLEVLKTCEIVTDVIVSTDSLEVKEVAQRHGASVPFMRPPHLADDFTGTAAVTKHAVEWYLRNVGSIDHVLTVYPTAVFLCADDIAAAFKLLQSSDCRAVLTGTEYPFPIQRALYLDEESRVSMFQPEHFVSRSQDLVRAYHDAGQFYFARVSAVLEDVAIFSPDSRMLVLPRHRVVDIDTPEDFEVAEGLFRLAQTGVL
jgi:pseudaminic acid cytidylyltransferase